MTVAPVSSVTVIAAYAGNANANMHEAASRKTKRIILIARASPGAATFPAEAIRSQQQASRTASLADRGSAIYAERCADCHGKDGAGVPGVYPPLDGNASVNEPTGINATRVVLLGGFSPVTAGNLRPYSMQPYAQQLNDADVAAVVTYIRQAWSNHASAVQERDVAAYRHTPID